MLESLMNFKSGVSVNPDAISLVSVCTDGAKNETVRIFIMNDREVIIVPKAEWDAECARINALRRREDYRPELRRLQEALTRLSMNIPHSIRVHP